MTFTDQLADLEKGRFERFYLLYGEEPYLGDLFLKKLRSLALSPGEAGLNLSFFDDENGGLGAAVRAAQTPPFLAARRVVIYQGQAMTPLKREREKDTVLEEEGDTGEGGVAGDEPGPATRPGLRESPSRGDGEGFVRTGEVPQDQVVIGAGKGARPRTKAVGPKGKRRQEAGAGGRREPAGGEGLLEEYLSSPADSTILALWARGGVDKRKRVFRLAGQVGRVIECQPLRGRELLFWTQRRARELGKSLSDETAVLLTTYAGGELSLLASQLDKLADYVGSAREIKVADVQAAVRKGSEARIFDLVDHLSRRETPRALGDLRELLRLGEPPARLLFMLARQVRLLLMTKLLLGTGLPAELISERLAVHPFVGQKLLAQAASFTEEELEAGLKHLLVADVALKESRQPADLLLEILILRLTGAAAVSR
ncbi:MAG: DNA polymerase III subunit delta [Firmicutes bacterium]|nr:DNA polymerase III subunit delta [Bacillota bacterium]